MPMLCYSIHVGEGSRDQFHPLPTLAARVGPFGHFGAARREAMAAEKVSCGSVGQP